MNKGGSCSAIRPEPGPNDVNAGVTAGNFRNHTEVLIATAIEGERLRKTKSHRRGIASGFLEVYQKEAVISSRQLPTKPFADCA